MSATQVKLNIRDGKQLYRGRRGQYQKSDSFYKEIDFWNHINANDDSINVCYIPLESGMKKPVHCSKLKPRGNQGKKYISQADWDWTEVKALRMGSKHHPIPIETCDTDFGVCISNRLGVLDFDCEKDYDWFKDTFDVDVSEYLVERGKFSKKHCNCCSTDNYGYHLYFKISDEWKGKMKSTGCIWDTEFKKQLKIDYLCEAKSGTPHIVKTVDGMDSREWVHKEVDSIEELPANVIKHFNQFWYSKKERDTEIVLKDNTQNKLLEFLRILPANYIFQTKKFYNVLRCLRANNVKYEDVFKWSVKLKQSNSKDNVESHSVWLKRTWANMSGEREFKDCKLIRNLVEEEDSEKYHQVHNKYLNINERHFSRKRLKDIQSSNLKLSDKLNMVKAYYNRFFIYVVDKSPSVYMLSYSSSGQSECELISGKAKEMRDSYGIMMKTKDDDDKQYNTFEWWLGLVGGNEYSRISFKPFGIPSRAENDYDTYNLFQGFNMKYVCDYNNSDADCLGDLIHKHFSEVLVCGNEKHLQGLYAWIYKMVVKGERTGVGVLFYSKMNGSGKSWIWESFSENVLGLNYVHKTANVSQTVGGNFTVGEDKTFMMIEELPQYRFDGKGGSNEVDCALKSIITDPQQRCRKLYKDEKMVESHINLMAFTNNLRCVNPEMAQRRLMMYILDCKYAGDTDYWTEFEKAMTYEGWENWIHRYIIQDKSLKKIKVLGNSRFLDEYANTDLRRLTMDRGLNSMVYWVRDYLDEIKSLAEDGDESCYSHFIGQHRPITDYGKPEDNHYCKGLHTHYKEYCEFNGMYCIAKQSNDFVEKLKTTFELVMVDLSVKFEDSNRDVLTQNPFSKKHQNLNVIRVNGKGEGNDGKKYYKKAYRSYIIFTEEVLLKLDLMVSNLITESVDVVNIESLELFKQGMKPMLECETGYCVDEFDKGCNGFNGDILGL